MLIEGSFGSPTDFSNTSPNSFPCKDDFGLFKKEPSEQQHPSLAHLLQSSVAGDRLHFECDSAKCTACFAHFPGSLPSGRHPGSAADKPFKCEQCGQSYKYQSAYAKHREQNHTARLPGEKPFRCEICGMQFRYF